MLIAYGVAVANSPVITYCTEALHIHFADQNIWTSRLNDSADDERAAYETLHDLVMRTEFSSIQSRALQALRRNNFGREADALEKKVSGRNGYLPA